MAESMSELNRGSELKIHLGRVARLAAGAGGIGTAIGVIVRTMHNQSVAPGIMEGAAVCVVSALTSCYVCYFLERVLVSCGLHEDLSPAVANILALFAALGTGVDGPGMEGYPARAGALGANKSTHPSHLNSKLNVTVALVESPVA